MKQKSTRSKNKKKKIEKVVISCSDVTDVNYLAVTYSRSVCLVKLILSTISELTLGSNEATILFSYWSLLIILSLLC